MTPTASETKSWNRDFDGFLSDPWYEPEVEDGINNIITDLIDGMESQKAAGLTLYSGEEPRYKLDGHYLPIPNAEQLDSEELTADLEALGIVYNKAIYEWLYKPQGTALESIKFHVNSYITSGQATVSLFIMEKTYRD
jgi:hypothetical protein